MIGTLHFSADLEIVALARRQKVKQNSFVTYNDVCYNHSMHADLERGASFGKRKPRSFHTRHRIKRKLRICFRACSTLTAGIGFLKRADAWLIVLCLRVGTMFRTEVG